MFSNESTPTFSIILPTHDRGHMISRAIMSLLRQTMADWELIVVDDGSRDNTREVVAGFGDPRVKYFYKENEERSIARNHGIDMASGRYVGFIDSDDFVEPNHLELAWSCLGQDQRPKIVLLGHSFVDDVTGEELSRHFPPDGDVFRALLNENKFAIGSIFVRRDLLREVRFVNSRDATIGEDWCLWLRLTARHETRSIHAITSHLLRHPGRSTSVIDPDQFRRSALLMLETLEADNSFQKARGAKVATRFEADLLLAIGQNYLINARRDRVEARKFMALAIRRDPRVVFSRRFLVCIKKMVIS